MVILTTFYNAENYIERCIASVLGQTFKNFKCYLIDDVSTDSSYELSKKLINNDERFVLIKNTEKKYKTHNYVSILNENLEIGDNEVIVELDGDDWLSNSNVLKLINEIYLDENIWITNGSFKYASGGMGFSSEQKNFDSLRTSVFTASHLRTWRAFLWKKIKDEDHKDSEGNYWKINADLAYMLPMLEMSNNKHYKFIPDILLIYNDINPLNDHKIDINLVNKLSLEIRRRKKYESI
jgi:glycosyltransferase involved in cell wall biosynthesis